MSKKPNLAEHLCRATDQSEANLLRLLHQADQHDRRTSAQPCGKVTPASPPDTSPAAPRRAARRKGPTPHTPSCDHPTDRWSTATATFNTRLPATLVELIEDLVYQIKKKTRRPVTKQALAVEAFEDFLRKHGML